MPRKQRNQRRVKSRGRVGLKGANSGMVDTAKYAIAPSIVSAMGGFGSSFRTKLRFSANSVFTSTSGVPVNQDWSLNSCYDPDVTSTGVQPTNFDDFMLHYGYFRVHNTLVEITMACRTATIPMEWVAYSRCGGTASAFTDAMAEPGAVSGTVGTMNSLPKKVRLQFHLPDIVGKAQFNSSLSFGTASASPSVGAVLRHVIKSADGSTTAVCDVLTVITYDVEFFQRLPTDLDYYKRKLELAKKHYAEAKARAESLPAAVVKEARDQGSDRKADHPPPDTQGKPEEDDEGWVLNPGRSQPGLGCTAQGFVGTQVKLRDKEGIMATPKSGLARRALV